jgi:hypothetical protein
MAGKPGGTSSPSKGCITAVVVVVAILYIVGRFAAGSGGHHHSANPPTPSPSCADELRSEIRDDETSYGFGGNEFRIPIAHCGSDSELGYWDWGTAQVVWNNGKIVWWECRDQVKCRPAGTG